MIHTKELGKLHTAAAPAVRAAVKTKLSYRNDMIIAFSFEANKTKANLRLLWPLLIVNMRIRGLINLTENSIFCSK